jgi:hypothetical protein
VAGVVPEEGVDRAPAQPDRDEHDGGEDEGRTGDDRPESAVRLPP